MSAKRRNELIKRRKRQLEGNTNAASIARSGVLIQFFPTPSTEGVSQWIAGSLI